MTEPIIVFKQVFGDPPIRASRSAEGTLPARAMRYCLPVSEASGHGWYLYPPMDFSIVFDGFTCLWSWGDLQDWYVLDRIQFPGFSAEFDKHAPSAGFAPPFLVMGEDPGLLQIWTGCFARTARDWSLMVRGPVNLDHSLGFEYREAIIETDVWFGPLFSNIMLRATNQRIDFKRDRPLFQVQPIHRATYGESVLSSVRVEQSLSAEDWEAYRTNVIVRAQAPRKLGAYAARGRQRRADERSTLT